MPTQLTYPHRTPEGIICVRVVAAVIRKDGDFNEYVKPFVEVSTGDNFLKLIGRHYTMKSYLHPLTVPPFVPTTSARTGRLLNWAEDFKRSDGYRNSNGGLVSYGSSVFEKLRILRDEAADAFAEQWPQWTQMSNWLRVEQELADANKYADKLAVQTAEACARVRELREELEAMEKVQMEGLQNVNSDRLPE